MDNPYPSEGASPSRTGTIMNILTPIFLLLTLCLGSFCCLSYAYSYGASAMVEIISDAYTTGVLTLNGPGLIGFLLYIPLSIWSGIALTITINAAWQVRRLTPSLLWAALFYVLSLGLAVGCFSLESECVTNVSYNGNEDCSVYFGSLFPSTVNAALILVASLILVTLALTLTTFFSRRLWHGKASSL